MTPKILSLDPYLAPYTDDIALRIANFKSARKRLIPKNGTLSDFANGHHPARNGRAPLRRLGAARAARRARGRLQRLGPASI